MIVERIDKRKDFYTVYVKEVYQGSVKGIKMEIEIHMET